MFRSEQLAMVDSGYFNIIMKNEKDVTIQSRNTGHYWYLHCTDQPIKGACIIFHKHKFTHPYHQHGKENSLKQAIKNIERHDRWYLKYKQKQNKEKL